MKYFLEMESSLTHAKCRIFLEHLRQTLILEGHLLTLSSDILPQEIKEPLQKAISRDLPVTCLKTNVVFRLPMSTQTGLRPEPKDLSILKPRCTSPEIHFPLIFQDSCSRLYVPLLGLPNLDSLRCLRPVKFSPAEPLSCRKR